MAICLDTGCLAWYCLSMEITPNHSPSTLPQFDGTYYMRVGKNGRVTLPLKIRQLLQLEENTEVEVKVEDGAVMVTGRLPTLEELAGSLPALPQNTTVDEIIHDAKSEHYADRQKRLFGQ